MELNKGETAIEDELLLLRSQTHVWNHIYAYVNSMSLNCAVQLGILDAIHKHGRPMTIAQLVEAIPINKAKGATLSTLIVILETSGFLSKHRISSDDGKNDQEEEEDEEGYMLTVASRLFLVGDRAKISMAPYVLVVTSPAFLNAFHHMSEWFKNDDPTSFYTAHGENIYNYMKHEPSLYHSFNEYMANDSRLVSSFIIRDCKHVFERLNSVVDVGGARGTLIEAIAEAFPNLECVNFDLPHVVEGLKGSKNLKHVGGDMFEAIPPADAVLLKWILHNWSDEDCVKILKRCKEVIPSKENGGVVIIIDIVMQNNQQEGDAKFHETQFFFNNVLAAVLNGRQRNEKDWAKLFCDAGFNGYKIIPTLGLRCLIEVYP